MEKVRHLIEWHVTDARPRSLVSSRSGESQLPFVSRSLGHVFEAEGRRKEEGEGCIQTSRLTRREDSRGGLHYHPAALDSLF